MARKKGAAARIGKQHRPQAADVYASRNNDKATTGNWPAPGSAGNMYDPLMTAEGRSPRYS